jgi:hypothetical protein
MSDEEIPEFGGSATFDFGGHLQSVEVHAEVPGAAEGSDPLQYEHDFTGHDDDAGTALSPGWMPGQHADPPLNFMDLPAPPGWHRDALGIEHPDLPGDPGQHHAEHENSLHMRVDEPEPEQPGNGE